jgi:diguanylate cyclase (GGDEF)-like protein
MRILVADSHVEHRQLLILRIQELGHEVEEALGEKEVLEICRRKCPDLLLIDMNLAGTSGINIVKSVRQLGGTAVWVPIVLVGNHLSDEEILQGVDAGADDFLNKPISLTLLKARIGSALRQQNLKEEVFSVAHNLVVANRALENVVSRDALTGVANASSFEEALEREWFSAKEKKTVLALMLLNLDYFRLYNESYGSEKGDEVLKQAAKALATLLNGAAIKSHNLARITGPTFAVLIANTKRQEVEQLAKQCNEAIEILNIPHEKSGCSTHVTVSIGIAVYENDNFKQPWDFKEEADYALYQAKHYGRNRYYLNAAVLSKTS